MEERKMMEISKETYDKLFNCKASLAKILRKKEKNVSFDKLFKLFFICEPLDLILQNMILEENPSVKFEKTPEKPFIEEKTNEKEEE